MSDLSLADFRQMMGGVSYSVICNAPMQFDIFGRGFRTCRDFGHQIPSGRTEPYDDDDLPVRWDGVTCPMPLTEAELARDAEDDDDEDYDGPLDCCSAGTCDYQYDDDDDDD